MIQNRSLLSKKVTIYNNAAVRKVESSSVCLQVSNSTALSILKSDLTIIAVGLKPTLLVQTTNIAKHANGSIATNFYLQSTGYANVFAVGDCAHIGFDETGRPVEYENSPTAQSAMQQAYTVAHNIATLLKQQRSLKIPFHKLRHTDITYHNWQRFKFVNLGEMLSLGKYSATVTCFGGWITMSGGIAMLVRRLVYCWRIPTWKQFFIAIVNLSYVLLMRVLKPRW